jgi:diguanylate cyclase (GGDEF)-like protein
VPRTPWLAELLQHGAPVVGTGADGDDIAELLPGAASWLAVPLVVDGAGVGVVLVSSAEGVEYTDAHIRIAAALAGQAITAYEKALLFAQVGRLATTDELTGVSNRRHFFAQAGEALRTASPSCSMAAVMLDIDRFKEVNDTHGHMVGDEVIREVAQRLAGAATGTDLLARYGGEEFVLVVAGRLDTAVALAERLRAVVANTPVETAAGPLTVTASVGVAAAHGGDRRLGSLLGRADHALYKAKSAGRNRVAVAPADPGLR